jgi:hypothetical protein
MLEIDNQININLNRLYGISGFIIPSQVDGSMLTKLGQDLRNEVKNLIRSAKEYKRAIGLSRDLPDRHLWEVKLVLIEHQIDATFFAWRVVRKQSESLDDLIAA